MRDKLGLKIVLSAIAAFFILGYAYHRTEDLIRGPRVTITLPVNGETVDAPLLRIRGTIKNSATLTINGQSILTDNLGEFNEDILLAHGYNTFEVRAEDRFGRSAVEKIEVVRK